MNATQALIQIIRPALLVLPEPMRGERAQILLLAIGLQESRFMYRKQTGGPARGFWQFERAGVSAVLKHPASRDLAKRLCAEQALTGSEQVHNALETDDILACQLARLLLYTDPAPLPAPGEVMSAWDYYVRNWRPGKPRKATWGEHYAQAVQAVRGD